MLRSIKYWYYRLIYYILINRFLHYLRIKKEFWCIEHKLRKKGYAIDSIFEIMQRYVNRKNYRTRIETRESYKELGQTIARISDKTGIPQWQLRTKLKNDFDIDT